MRRPPRAGSPRARSQARPSRLSPASTKRWPRRSRSAPFCLPAHGAGRTRLHPTRRLHLRNWAHHARKILLLRERYDTSDLDAALAHASVYGAFDAQSVERILLARSRPRTLDEYVTEATTRRLAETLGAVRTEPRDLAEYDRLPVSGVSPASRALGAPQQETLPGPKNALPETPPQTTTASQPATPPTPATRSSSNCDDTSHSSD